jgi:hypothetical protein
MSRSRNLTRKAKLKISTNCPKARFKIRKIINMIPLANIISGSCGTFASTCAKVGFNFNDGWIQTFTGEEFLFGLSLNQLLLHGLFIGLTLLLNSLMLRFFAASMGVHGAPKATVYNFAVIYVLSLTIGGLIFKEQI